MSFFEEVQGAVRQASVLVASVKISDRAKRIVLVTLDEVIEEAEERFTPEDGVVTLVAAALLYDGRKRGEMEGREKGERSGFGLVEEARRLAKEIGPPPPDPEPEGEDPGIVTRDG